MKGLEVIHTTNPRLSLGWFLLSVSIKMADSQKISSADDQKINQLIASLQVAIASLADYNDENKTYRIDANAMLNVISSLELIEAKKD